MRPQAQQIVDEMDPEPTARPYSNLKFRLPDGTRFGRKFTKTTTLAQLRAYVAVELGKRESPILRFHMFLASKRRTFTEDDNDETLAAVGLSADVLLIQDLDV